MRQSHEVLKDARRKPHILVTARRANPPGPNLIWPSTNGFVTLTSMVQTLFILLLFVGATPAHAETIMTPAEFEAYVSGKTLYFNRHGEPYGAEQYLSDRRVIWTFLDGRCQRGYWYGEQQNICFVYENLPDPQCWNFLNTDKGRAARLLDAPPENDLIVAGQDEQLLPCPGPQVGVSYSPSLIEK